MRWLLALVPMCVLATARPADACGAPVCFPGGFVPGDGTTIPQNAPGLYWRPGFTTGGSDPATVTLTTTAAPSTPLPFTAKRQANGDYVIVPDAPLVAGTTYALEDAASCAAPRVTFTAGATAPLPGSLGTASLIGHQLPLALEVATTSGSCSTTIDTVYVSIELALAAEALPWASLFLYETVVDDQPWVVQETINVRNPPGASWRGRGRDLLFRTCTENPLASFPGMSIGGHQYAFRATLPDVPGVLATPPSSVELMCDGADGNDGDLGDDVADGGCSSSTPGASTLLLLLGVLVLRRRRQ